MATTKKDYVVNNLYWYLMGHNCAVYV